MLRFYALSLVAWTMLQATPAAAFELTQWESYTEGEEEVARKLSEELIGQLRSKYVAKGNRVFRDAHPRGIGCVEAKFTVDPALPIKYRSGVFATPGKSYDALLRFSSSLGPVGDNKKDARGLAIKLFGVDGPKLSEGQTDAKTHDFLQINAPTFPAVDTKDFAGLVSISTNPANIVKFLLEAPIRHARELAALLKATQGNPFNGKSLLAQQFFSQTPYLFRGTEVNGPVKFSTRPCRAIITKPLDGSEAELRNDLQDRLLEEEGCFEFVMQFFKAGAGLLVEDGMNEWTENKAPFVKFATINIPKQTFLTDEKLAYCDKLSFHPWHALAEHRPLGNINRSRKVIYEAISRFRHDVNREADQYKEPVDFSQWRSFISTDYSAWRGVTVPASP